MGAKALSKFLLQKYPQKKYFYIVSDYTWGWSSEESIRKFTETEDKNLHKVVYTPFLNSKEDDFQKAVTLAKIVKPDVLILILFGNDMSYAIRYATMMGLKNEMQIIVPILELSLAEKAGLKVMEGVVGASDWNWKVPFEFNYEKGKAFVEKYSNKYKRYPCWGASTTYTNIYQYKEAVEKAQSFQTNQIIKALEGNKFTLLKDEQEWRAFDHQNIQSVYIVKCQNQEEVKKDKFELDYFKILEKFPGESLVKTYDEWKMERLKYKLPPNLEDLI